MRSTGDVGYDRTLDGERVVRDAYQQLKVATIAERSFFSQEVCQSAER